MPMSLNAVLDLVAMAALLALGYALTRPLRLTVAQRDAVRIAASTALILSGTLHLALRLHLVI